MQKGSPICDQRGIPFWNEITFVLLTGTKGMFPYVLGKHSNPLYNRIAGQTANRPSLRTERNRSFGDSS